MWWDENVGAEPLPDAEAVAKVFDSDEVGFGMHGERSFAYFIAPGDGEAVLRVDIHHDEGRAALRWLPDGTHAVELDPAEPIQVWETYRGVVTIPAELVRVSVDTARRAVTEYVTTGQRPTSVEWMSE